MMGSGSASASCENWRFNRITNFDEFATPLRKAGFTSRNPNPIMKPKYTYLLALALSCFVSQTSSAQDGERKGQPQRGGGEGGASRIAEMVKKADTNADGKISKEEFVGASSREAEERFSKLDANSDGSVDSTEINQIAGRLREGMANRGAGAEGGGSGFRRPPEGGGPPPEGGPPRGQPEGGPPRDQPEGGPPLGQPEGGPQRGGPAGGAPGMMFGGNPEEAFTRMDKNSDGSVDLAEFSESQKAELENRFKRMDENGDGKFTKEEMKSAMEKLRSMMQRSGQGQGRGPSGSGGPSGGDGGFRRPPSGEGGAGRPRPEVEGDAPKKEGV